MKEEKDTSVAVIVIQNIVPNFCQKKNSTPMARDIRKKKETKEKRQEKCLIIMQETST
jgi:hypothetical protein